MNSRKLYMERTPFQDKFGHHFGYGGPSWKEILDASATK